MIRFGSFIFWYTPIQGYHFKKQLRPLGKSFLVIVQLRDSHFYLSPIDRVSLHLVDIEEQVCRYREGEVSNILSFLIGSCIFAICINGGIVMKTFSVELLLEYD